jgi:hypothetical protein
VAAAAPVVVGSVQLQEALQQRCSDKQRCQCCSLGASQHCGAKACRVGNVHGVLRCRVAADKSAGVACWSYTASSGMEHGMCLAKKQHEHHGGLLFVNKQQVWNTLPCQSVQSQFTQLPVCLQTLCRCMSMTMQHHYLFCWELERHQRKKSCGARHATSQRPVETVCLLKTVWQQFQPTCVAGGKRVQYATKASVDSNKLKRCVRWGPVTGRGIRGRSSSCTQSAVQVFNRHARHATRVVVVRVDVRSTGHMRYTVTYQCT